MLIKNPYIQKWPDNKGVVVNILEKGRNLESSRRQREQDFRSILTIGDVIN